MYQQYSVRYAHNLHHCMQSFLLRFKTLLITVAMENAQSPDFNLYYYQHDIKKGEIKNTNHFSVTTNLSGCVWGEWESGGVGVRKALGSRSFISQHHLVETLRKPTFRWFLISLWILWVYNVFWAHQLLTQPPMHPRVPVLPFLLSQHHFLFSKPMS